LDFASGSEIENEGFGWDSELTIWVGSEITELNIWLQQ